MGVLFATVGLQTAIYENISNKKSVALVNVIALSKCYGMVNLLVSSWLGTCLGIVYSVTNLVICRV